MKKISKLLCLVLAVMMIVSVMSVGAFAAKDSGTDDAALSGSLLDSLLGALNGGSGADLGSIVNSLKGVISGGGAASVADKLKNLSPDSISAVLGKLTGTTSSADLQKIVSGLSDKLSGTDLSKVLSDLGGKISGADMSKIVSDLAGKLGTGDLSDMLAKLKGSVSGADFTKIIADLKGKLGDTDMAALLKQLSDKLPAADFESLLKNLVNSGAIDTSLLDKLKGLTGSSSTTTIIEKIISTMTGGSDTDIKDEDTPLAGSLALNTTDHNAFVTGRTANTFAPGGNLTRAEAAVMLYALLTDESKALYAGNANTFSDVPGGTWYANAVTVLAAGGAISGYPDNTFRPNNNIKRSEFVTMIVALYGTTSGAASPFSDVPTSHWAYNYIATAYSKGWVSGYENNTFKPDQNINRAEAVSFLDTVLGRSCDLSYVYSHASSVKTFVDVGADRWFFGAVMEAANSHNYTKASSGAETWTGLR